MAIAAALLGAVALSAPVWIEGLLRAATELPEASPAIAPARVVASFPEAAPELFESVALGSDGVFLVSLLTRGEIWRVEPDGSHARFARIPSGPFSWRDFDGFIGALVLDPSGDLFVTVGARNRDARGVWRVDSRGEAELFAPLGTDVWPNGIALAPSGDLFVADSAAPRIWRVERATRGVSVWLEHELLERSGSRWLPGVNGVQFFEGAIYASNTSAATIVRVPLRPEGAAGTPSVFADGVSADDFAFGARGDLYVTTHPRNRVLRRTREGVWTILATAEQGAVGPTSAAFHRDRSGRETLYVLNDGGFMVPTHRGTPNLLALDLAMPSGR